MSKKIPREFVPLDVSLPSERAIARAGTDAEHLYMRGLMYCKREKTDGHIPSYDLDIVATRLSRVKARVSALVREGLWEETAEGWDVPAWSKWNMTREEIADEKDKRREGAIKTNHDRWHGDGKRDDSCPHCQPEVLPLQRSSQRAQQ